MATEPRGKFGLCVCNNPAILRVRIGLESRLEYWYWKAVDRLYVVLADDFVAI